MRRGIGALLGFALALAGFGLAAPAAAQTATTGVISGRVVDGSGQPRGRLPPHRVTCALGPRRVDLQAM